MNKELTEIKKSIENENISYAEISYLQCHIQEVLDTGDIRLCEWAGITEEEYNNGKLNPDLSFEKDFIKLEIDNDGEGNPICTIKLDDNQELVLTCFELLNLKDILTENKEEIKEYFEQVYRQV